MLVSADPSPSPHTQKAGTGACTGNPIARNAEIGRARTTLENKNAVIWLIFSTTKFPTKLFNERKVN